MRREGPASDRLEQYQAALLRALDDAVDHQQVRDRLEAAGYADVADGFRADLLEVAVELVDTWGRRAPQR